MNKFAKVFGMTVLAVSVMAGCSEQSVKKDTASPEVKEKMAEETASQAEVTQEEPKQEEAKEEKKEIAKMGETLNVDGVKITVTSIEAFNGRINQFEPLTQDHAVKVGVIVENSNQDAYFIDANEFTMYDAEGFQLTNALPGEESPLSTEIAGGKKATGFLYFDVPAQEGTWEVHYSSMASFGGEPAVWEVPAK